MNKTELIAAVAEDVGVGKKDTEQVLNAFFSTVQETLKQNDKVQIPGFGSFEVRERAARTGRNPHTGETIEIAGGALEQIPKAIVEANSPDVDVVSGATYTSKGIMNAVKDALGQGA